MRIPRWTTYPAIAVVLFLALIALPKGRPGRGAAQHGQQESITTEAERARAEREAKSLAAIESERSAAVTTAAAALARPQTGRSRSVLEFLPAGYAIDGSVDYRAELQRAIEASVGATLELPDFPIRIGRAPGQVYGVRLLSGTHLVGQPTSLLFTDEPGLQLLRGEGVENLTVESVALRGPGGDGHGLAHGLLQITGGHDVALRHLDVWSADCDGIALSQVERCRIESCIVIGASKSAIYLTACDGAIVQGNHVREFGGHVAPSGKRVGVGLQLSSCRDVVCSDNLVAYGLGVGILCNANQSGAAPKGHLIANNRVHGVTNGDNPGVSGGIRLANGSADKRTETLVTGNSVSNCGWNGLYLENHDGSLVSGNLVTRSERAGVLVSTIDGLQLTDNLVTQSGTANSEATPAIHLVNGARNVVSRGNGGGAPDSGPVLPHTRSQSQRSPNSLEPRVVHLDAPPSLGSWARGDLAFHASPSSGAPLGWVCVQSGTPGTWSAFGRVE